MDRLAPRGHEDVWRAACEPVTPSDAWDDGFSGESGMKQAPGWFRNLRSASRVHGTLDVDCTCHPARSATVSVRGLSWSGTSFAASEDEAEPVNGPRVAYPEREGPPPSVPDRGRLCVRSRDEGIDE